MIQQTYLQAGEYRYPVKMCVTPQRIFFQFGFNKKLMEEIKAMAGCQYHGYDGAPNRDIVLSVYGTDKIWSVSNCSRNKFQIAYLEGKNPYARFDEYLKNPLDFDFKRELRAHQKDLVVHGLMVHYAIWAAEPGTGKTLAAIEVMERSGHDGWWYVAPKSALRSVELEFRKWDFKLKPRLMTYNELVSRMKQWADGTKAPPGVIFDESQRIKTPSAQRSVAARGLADGIREDWGDDGFVIAMSGSPAPKAPTDWWNQAEVVCPGFLREGTLSKFQTRLGLHEDRESIAGGVFKQRITWLDDENKCAKCGYPLRWYDAKTKQWREHTLEHGFRKSENEVAKLYRRLNGLVVVKLKKDCIELPEKQYRVIRCKTSPSTIRAAKMLSAKGNSAAKTLIQLRELSDGFQYVEHQDGEKDCDACKGQGEVYDFVLKGPEPPEDGHYNHEDYYERKAVTCSLCAGKCKVARYVRAVERIPSPKDDVFREILDEYSDVGRLVVYAGFEGSVDRCVEIALHEKWAVIKWDGKGIKVWNQDGNPLRLLPGAAEHWYGPEGEVEPIRMFQQGLEEFPRVCFIGNAGAAGTGLTLTASPAIFYYSNDFNAENRIQSEERIHRLGMDENRGATIIDVVNLPTDAYVLDNLKKKVDLQNLTMGDWSSILDDENYGKDRLF